MKYRIYKILNNNAIVSRDLKGRETIVIGSGIGFHTRIGKTIDSESIEGIYVLQKNENYSKLTAMLEEIPFECIKVTEDIIQMAEQELKRELSKNLLLPLSDHIYFALEQNKQGITPPKLLSEEIKRFYKAEYNVGLKAVDIINDSMKVNLPRDEATSIAFHLISAESGNKAEATRVIEETNEILSIIESELQIKFDEDSLSCSRMILHTKYFVKSVLSSSKKETEIPGMVVFNQEDELYNRISGCLDKIASHLKNKLGYELGEDDRFYMLLHILNILQSDRKRESGLSD